MLSGWLILLFMSLKADTYYHIYNRGIDSCDLFLEDKHFIFFLQNYSNYIFPIAETFAYCLMKNHFHFLIRIRTKEEQQKIFEEQISNGKQEFKIKEPSRQFAHLFNKYTKNFNKWMSRTGKLFEQSFKRKEISDESYLIHVLCYIHRNPIHHKVEEKYNTYPYSSYRALLSNASTRLEKEKVLTWFQGEKAFINAHKEMKSKIIPKTMLE